MHKKLDTIKEIMFWSYANLAMAHSAVEKRQFKYATYNYMIRAKLYRGLMDGDMNVGTLFDDEKIKLASGNVCSYCGKNENLALDHILPKSSGGKDTGDNLIYACKACNGSKGKKDMMEWMASRNTFPPLLVLRRYLKLVISYCVKNDLLDLDICKAKTLNLPFPIECIPLKFPDPSSLILMHGDRTVFGKHG